VAPGCKWQKPNDESAAEAPAVAVTVAVAPGAVSVAAPGAAAAIDKVLVDMERAHQRCELRCRVLDWALD